MTRMLRAVRGAFCWICTLAMAAQADEAAFCALILDAETDVAFIGERLTDRTVIEQQARRIEAQATTASSTAMAMWLAEGYRDLARGAPVQTFAVEAREILRRLRDDHPECDFNRPGSAIQGEVLLERPVATNDTALDRNGNRWQPDERTVLQEHGGTVAMSFGGVLASVGLSAFVWWRRVGRYERAERHPCFIAAEYMKSDHMGTCTMEDVSRYGSKVHMTEPGLVVGDRVAVTCRFFNMAGTIRWANKSFVGLHFAKPLTPDELDMLIGAVVTREEHELYMETGLTTGAPVRTGPATAAQQGT